MRGIDDSGAVRARVGATPQRPETEKRYQDQHGDDGPSSNFGLSQKAAAVPRLAPAPEILCHVFLSRRQRPVGVQVMRAAWPHGLWMLMT